MSKEDSNVRRSSRILTKRASKINYKEIEDGKDFSQDDDSVEQEAQRDYEEEVVTGLPKKGGKLCHPKKSLTAYTLFVKINRKKLQEEDPNKTTPQLMKEIGRLWKNIGEKEKNWFQTMAMKDKERYKREMDEMQRLKDKYKMNDCELQRPKKCLSSYMIFVREVRTKVTQEFPNMNALDVMKEVGNRWQSITELDKSYFQDMANKDKDRFKRENQKYMKELEQLDAKLKSEIKATGKQGDEIYVENEPTDLHGKFNEFQNFRSYRERNEERQSTKETTNCLCLFQPGGKRKSEAE